VRRPDSLVSGHRTLVGDADLVVGDIADAALVRRTIEDYSVDAVMHFAAFAYVGESVAHPGLYYRNNVAATVHLLNAVVEAGVRRIVFSSTCATYGMPVATPMTEDHPQQPVNPYGASKLMVERILSDFDRAYALRSVVLRYFNAAGAYPAGGIGERHDPETHLIPLAPQAAGGQRDSVAIFGTDYPTPDGTGVRDYIHVEDLASAHIKALDYLRGKGASTTLNCGYGHGYSVRELISMVDRVNGRALTIVESPRRAGDPPTLVARAQRVREVLGWVPHYDNLEEIVRSQLHWERRLQREPGLQKN
jgi:UDP-glucose 4-epimerase